MNTGRHYLLPMHLKT